MRDEDTGYWPLQVGEKATKSGKDLTAELPGKQALRFVQADKIRSASLSFEGVTD
jgi:hypothetical protein